MENVNAMTRISDDQVQLFDDAGQLLGTIVRPVTPDVLGPGAEKVYLARRTPRAAHSADRSAQHAA